MSKDYTEIGTRLKRVRTRLGLTQNEMGDHLGIGQSYGNIERGSVATSDAQFVSICNRLSLDYDWLVTGIGKSPAVLEAHTPAPEAVAPEPRIEDGCLVWECLKSQYLVKSEKENLTARLTIYHNQNTFKLELIKAEKPVAVVDVVSDARHILACRDLIINSLNKAQEVLS